jgi:PAS domain S-box-containing protein
MKQMSVARGRPETSSTSRLRVHHRGLAPFVFFFFLSSLCFAAESPSPKNVLVLYSFTARDTFYSLEPLKSAIRSHVRAPVHFEVEYLESERFGIPGYRDSVSEVLHHSYQNDKFDLVIVAAYPALRFAIDYRDRLFPGVPIVFLDVVADRLKGQKLPQGVTGVTTVGDIPGTLDLAFRLFPHTKSVAVITGLSEFEKFWLSAVHKQFRPYADRLKLIDLAGFPPAELLRQVAALPPHTIVLFQLVPVAASQPVIGTYDILAAVSQRFPTFCIFDYCLDRGGIGGSYGLYDQQVPHIGDMAARLLAGEKPENIPVVQTSGARAKVDWRQLQKWNITESALPPGSVVLYRQPTVWERYKAPILFGIFLIVFQALLISGLLSERAKKRKSEASLRESEKRFRVMADTAPSLIWMCDKDGKVTYRSQKRVAFTGGSPESGLGGGWTTYVHPDDLKSVLETRSGALQSREGFSKEYRLRRHDGVYRWMFDIASPRFDATGLFSGFIGSAIDITDQKLATEALEKVSGRLLEAQEKERSRIARELHDDICQRLALLSLELEQVNETSNGSGGPSDTKMTDIRKHCADIASDVQALSHELHSSKLDYLGLVAAIRSFCKEFSKQQGVKIEFTHENVPVHLPRDISLCLFRVAQEALHNAVKHSGVSQFAVHLSYTADHLQLEVRDSGVGFTVGKAMKDAGLGLVSMRERIHLVNGALEIDSTPNQGTRLVARVPLVADVGAAAAAAARA